MLKEWRSGNRTRIFQECSRVNGSFGWLVTIGAGGVLCTLHESEFRSFTFHPEQVQIEPDWNAFGLKATASHTISVMDAFVADEMTFLLTEPKAYEQELIYSIRSLLLHRLHSPQLLLALQNAF